MADTAGTPKAALDEAIAGLTDEAYGYVALALCRPPLGKGVFPDELGGFSAASQAAIGLVQDAAEGFVKQGTQGGGVSPKGNAVPPVAAPGAAPAITAADPGDETDVPPAPVHAGHHAVAAPAKTLKPGSSAPPKPQPKAGAPRKR